MPKLLVESAKNLLELSDFEKTQDAIHGYAVLTHEGSFYYSNHLKLACQHFKISVEELENAINADLLPQVKIKLSNNVKATIDCFENKSGSILLFEFSTETKPEEIKADEVLNSIISEYSSGSISIVDSTLKIVKTGGQGYANSGFDPDSLQGVNLREFLNKDALTFIDSNLDRILSGEHLEQQLEFKGAFYLNSYFPILDAESEKASYFVVTSTKLHPSTFRYDRDKLYSIIQASLNEIYLFRDDDLSFSFMNDGALLNLGYEPDEIERLTPLDLKPSYNRESFNQLVNPLRKGEQSSLIFETIHKRKNGTHYPIQILLQYFQFDDGNYFIAIGLDQTEKEKYNRRLERKIRLLRQAEKQAKLGSWELYPGEGSEIYWSEQMHHIFEWPLDKTPPSLFEHNQFFNNQDYQKLIKTIDYSLKQKKPYKIELTLYKKSGEKRFLIAEGQPKMGSNGHIELFQGFVQDVTELRKTERELKNTNSALDSFVYSVSHDLRSPIASSIGLTTLMQQTDKMHELKHYAALQQKSLEKLDEFIIEILDFSRNSRLEVTKAKVNISALVDEVLDTYRMLINTEGIIIEHYIEESDRFLTDEFRLRIVLRNLISNAIKFRDTSKSQNRIEIIGRPVLGQYVVSIKDNGLGIAQEYVEKIFEMFYRANEQTHGTGLGLYMVKQTLLKLDGTIWVDSTPKAGSNFTFSLPLEQKIAPK